MNRREIKQNKKYIGFWLDYNTYKAAKKRGFNMSEVCREAIIWRIGK